MSAYRSNSGWKNCGLSRGIWPPQRIVNDDGPAIGEGLNRMAHINRYDSDQAGSGDLGCAVDGYLKLALDHLVDLFLRMEVLVNGRAALEVVMRECHARRVENSVHTSRVGVR